MSEDDKRLRAFAQQLQAEVHERVMSSEAGDGPAYGECAFAEIVSDYLSELGAIENPEIRFHESAGPHGALMRVAGFAVSDDSVRLDLLATVYGDWDPLTQVPREELVRAATRARRVFEAAREGYHKKMEPASPAFDMFAKIYAELRNIKEVRIHVLTNGIASSKKIENQDAAHTPVRVEVWGVERLFRGMMAGLPREEIEIDFEERFGESLNCLSMPRSTDEFSAFLTVFPGEILFQLYDEYGPRLLELNVRSFLSVSGKVNRKIRKTLQEEPQRFGAFNNGIVITVDEIATEKKSGGLAIRLVRGLQIVNGGQTTASIHRAKKVDGADISHVFVPAKIIVVQPDRLEEMVRLVSLYANSQNVIQIADFSANDPYHVEIERLSSVVWCPGGQGRWFYERARGQYQVAKAREGSTPAALKRFNEKTPSHRKFTKTDLAKFLNSWGQRPDLVSFGAQKNFEHFMQALKANQRADWVPDETYYKDLVAKAILFKSAQRIVKQAHFPAYQANVLTYLVAYLSWRTGSRLGWESIWTRQALSEQLLALLGQWAGDIDNALRSSAGSRMVSEWAKKEACWEAMRATDLPLPDPLPPEMSSISVRATAQQGEGGYTSEHLTPQDYENIDACKKVSGEEWLRIHAWGRKTGKLQRWQIGIAHTLASYAASGWDKGPSAKQARHGVAIVKLVSEASGDAESRSNT